MRGGQIKDGGCFGLYFTVYLPRLQKFTTTARDWNSLNHRETPGIKTQIVPWWIMDSHTMYVIHIETVYWSACSTLHQIFKGVGNYATSILKNYYCIQARHTYNYTTCRTTFQEYVFEGYIELCMHELCMSCIFCQFWNCTAQFASCVRPHELHKNI